EGRKDRATDRMSGRARDGRLVHFDPAPEPGGATGDAAGGQAQPIRPGDFVTATVTGAAPHHLIADSGVRSHSRTRAGDAFEAGRTLKTQASGVGLGMPTIGAPRDEPAAPGCGE